MKVNIKLNEGSYYFLSELISLVNSNNLLEKVVFYLRVTMTLSIRGLGKIMLKDVRQYE